MVEEVTYNTLTVIVLSILISASITCMMQGILQLQRIDYEFNGADLLTKPFKDTMLFERHRKHLMGY